MTTLIFNDGVGSGAGKPYAYLSRTRVVVHQDNENSGVIHRNRPWPGVARRRSGHAALATGGETEARQDRATRGSAHGAVRARYPHHGYDVAAKYLSAEIEGCRAFCVERNPYDKAVSAFHFVYDRYNRPVTDPGQHSRNSASPRGWLRSPISTCTRVMANW